MKFNIKSLLYLFPTWTNKSLVRDFGDNKISIKLLPNSLTPYARNNHLSHTFYFYDSLASDRLIVDVAVEGAGGRWGRRIKRTSWRLSWRINQITSSLSWLVAEREEIELLILKSNLKDTCHTPTTIWWWCHSPISFHVLILFSFSSFMSLFLISDIILYISTKVTGEGQQTGIVNITHP